MLMPFFVLAALGMLPYASSGVSGIIDPGDCNFPLFPLEAFERQTFTWDSNLAILGTDAGWSFPCTIPYWGAIAVLHLVLKDIGILNRLWYFLVFSSSGWSMYLLAIVLYKGKARKEVGLASAIFYMYNPVAAQLTVHGINTYVFVYSTAPLFFALIVKAFDHLNGPALAYRYAILASFFYSITQVVNTIQVQALVLIAPASYVLFKAITSRSRSQIFALARVFLLILFLLVLFDMYWVLPTIDPTTVQQAYTIQSSEKATLQNLLSASKHVDYLSLFRLSPKGWTFGFYTSTLGLFTNSLIVVLCLMAVFAKRINKDAIIPFTGALGVVLLLLATGSSPPLGGIYVALYNISYAKAFLPTDPAKFIITPIALIFSILFGRSLHMLYSLSLQLTVFFRHHFSWMKGTFLSKGLVLAVCALVLFNAHPMYYNNDFVTPVNIPDYYFEARKWLVQQNESFRILLLPSPHFLGYTRYTWAPYDMADISYIVFPKPRVFDPSGLERERYLTLLRTGIDLVENSRSNVAGKILGLMSIKYLVVRSDLADEAMGHTIRTFDYSSRLLEQRGISKETDFGLLSFYRNSYFAPVIYVANDIISLNGTNKLLEPMTELRSPDINHSALINLQDLEGINEREAISISNSLFTDLDIVNGSQYLLSNTLKHGYVFTWKTPSVQIYLPFGASYNLCLFAKCEDHFEVLVDDSMLVRPNWDEGKHIYGLLHLSKGIHKLTLLPWDPMLTVMGVLVMEEQNRASALGEPTYGRANISFQEVNPTQYLVQVNAQEPFVLVFTSNYSPGWKAYVDGHELRHFRVNFYANGYYVTETGKFNVVLRYTPQEAFTMGVMISLFSACAAGVIVLVLEYVRRQPRSRFSIALSGALESSSTGHWMRILLCTSFGASNVGIEKRRYHQYSKGFPIHFFAASYLE